jgi:hypothetical protein
MAYRLTRGKGAYVVPLVGLLAAMAPSLGAAEPGVFRADQRLLATYFFSRGPWDDTAVTSGGTLGMSGTWKAIYPPLDDPRAAIFGLDAASKWPGDALPDTAAWPVTYKDEKRVRLRSRGRLALAELRARPDAAAMLRGAHAGVA